MISFLPEHFLIASTLLFISYCCINNLSLVYGFPKLYNSIIWLMSILVINFMMLTLVDLPFGELHFNQFFTKTGIVSIIHIFISLTLLMLMSNLHYYNKHHNITSFEFYIIILLSLLSIVLLVSSKEIISFFFLLELQGFSFYILASFQRQERKSIESGLKYLILSSFSSLLILLGFSFIYATSGLMNFSDIYYFTTYSDTTDPILYISFILISAGFLFKLYNFPFHFWVSDIYQGSPTSSVSIFSTIPLLGIFYAFYIIIFHLYYNIIVDIKYILIVSSISTMIIGTLFALYQRKVKRLLAYSSVSNIGYIMSSIINDSIIGLHNGMLFICIYIINLLGVFIIFLNLYEYKQKYNLENFYLLSGFFKTHKNYAVLLLVYLFSLAGIPPFSSFFSKLFLISSLYNESFYALVLIMVLTTFLGAFYYIRVIKTMTYNANGAWHFIKPLSFTASMILMLLVLFQLFFGLFPSMLSLFIYNGIIDFFI